MSAYSELLKDPRWQRKRLEILSAADFTCEDCGDKEKTLHVHHKIYKRGAKPWEYQDYDLQCLCADCHERTTAIGKRFDSVLSDFKSACGSYEMLWVIGAMQACIGMSHPTPDVEILEHEESIGVAARLAHCEPSTDGLSIRELSDLMLGAMGDGYRVNIFKLVSSLKK